jgi:hypothetical protein
MNQALRKFISVTLLVIFLLGSGSGQLIHAAFHKHSFLNSQQKNTSVSLPQAYCTALQLMLPEFSDSSIPGVSIKIIELSPPVEHFEISIPYTHFYKTSDRAPPVLA